MANSALINELHKQFAENPRRVFARLANEYRKMGELESAIEICRQHVPLQPTYISGHIVLGQALYESGQLDEARSTFETALELDPENLIALRQLGDIARAYGDLDGARSWYQRLLEVDPQNGDAVAQLQELDANGTSNVVPEMEPDAGVSWGDINPERTEPEAAIEPVATLSHFEMLLEPSAVEHLDEPASASALDDPPAMIFVEAAELEAPELHVLDTPAVHADSEAVESPGEFAFADSGARPADTDTGDEPTAPEAAIPPVVLASIDDLLAPAAAASPASDESYGDESYDESQNEVAAEDAAAPSAFATETMAELYARQGFPDRALAIYRQLAEHRTDDAALRDRIAELEDAASVNAHAQAAPTGRSAREFFSALAYRRPPRSVAPVAQTGAPPRAEWPAVQSPTGGGNGLPALFANGSVTSHDDQAAVALAGAYAGAYAPATLDTAGAPARPASDALSLDRVFGGGDAPPPAPAEGAMSFDEFFARDDQRVSTGGAATSTSAADAASPTDDLELFHAWLEGLKK